MKSSTRWMALPVFAILAACGADTDQDDIDLADSSIPTTEQPPLAETPQPMAPVAMSETAQVQALGDSGLSGETTITDRGTQTEVMVSLTDAPASATMPGHIHSGSCDNVGGVVIPLEEISIDESGSGMMTATVDVAPMTAMNGQHIVVYHGEGGTPAACAAIPAHTM